MTAYVVSSGVTSSGITLGALDTMTVLAGGTTVSITDSGKEYVSSGGAADFTTVMGGGLLVLSSGAAASGLTVSSGGLVSGPGELGGYSTDYDYGTIVGVTVGSNYPNGGDYAYLYVESGGLLSASTEDSYSVDVMSGGVARGTVLNNPYDWQYALFQVDFGGVASGTVIEDGYANVYGKTYGTVVHDNYESVQSGGESFGATVSSGATEFVYSGGIASGAVIEDGYANVYGKTYGTTVSSGGTEFVYSGGAASGGTVSVGGLLALSYGATASGVTVVSGGAVDIGEVGAGTVVVGPAQSTTTLVDGVTVQSGGVINVQNATILSGATLSLAAGADAGGVSVSFGATILGPGELGGGRRRLRLWNHRRRDGGKQLPQWRRLRLPLR